MNDQAQHRHVRLFGETTGVDIIGGKAASLSRMAAAGMPVMIAEAPAPPDVEEEAPNAYRALTTGASGPMPVPVRPSATAEDLPGASFAGRHDTCLSVGSEQDMVQAVLKRWASLRSVHAIAYREARRIAHGPVAMPAVLQSRPITTL